MSIYGVSRCFWVFDRFISLFYQGIVISSISMLVISLVLCLSEKV